MEADVVNLTFSSGSPCNNLSFLFPCTVYEVTGLPDTVLAVILLLCGGFFNLRLILILFYPQNLQFRKSRLGSIALNRCFADVLVLIACALLHVFTNTIGTNGTPLFGIFSLLLNTVECVSTVSLVWIAIERHRVICATASEESGLSTRSSSVTSAQGRWKTVKMKVPLLLTWCLSIIIGVAYHMLMMLHLEPRPPLPSSAIAMRFLALLGPLLFYIIPLTIIGIVYSAIARKLFISAKYLDSFQAQIANRRRRTAIVILALVLLFALLWFPFHFYYLFLGLKQGNATAIPPPSQRWAYVLRIGQLLGVTQSALNPLILCLMSESMRRQFFSV